MTGNFNNAAAAHEAEASKERRCDRGICTYIVLGLLAALLTFTIGLIVGAFLAATVFLALPAIIVLAVVLAVLIAIILIYRWCMGDRRGRERGCR